MKRSIVVALLLCLLLTACARTTDDGTTAPSSTPVPTTTTPHYIDCGPLPLPFFTTSSYEEYQAFVDQQDLPEDFVPYEKLSFIAPFCRIQVQKDPAVYGLEYYSYYLETTDGFIYGVEFCSFECDRYTDREKEIDRTLNGDLCTLETEEDGYIRLNNAFWCYDDGELNLIGIEFDEFAVHIIPMGYGDSFKKVDYTHHEIMQKLLHADTAEAAVHAFMEAIES